MNAHPATLRSRRQPVRGRRSDLAELGILALLFALAAWGFAPVYGTSRLAVTIAGGILLGLGLAWVSRRWRLGLLPVVGIALLTHLLLGSAMAAPESALLGILPTPASLLEMLTAPITTWRTVLTMAPPVGTSPGVLTAAWLSTFVLSLISGIVLLRTRLSFLAWLGPLLLLALTVVLGTIEQTFPFVRGIAIAAVSLAWLTWRFESSRVAQSRSTIVTDAGEATTWRSPAVVRRIVGGALVIGLSAGAALVAKPALDVPPGAARYAERDHIVPPFRAIDYTSPLAQFRGYRKNQKDATLFTVTGVHAGELMPLAVMDQYTPTVYQVAESTDARSSRGAFLRTASHVTLVNTPSSTRKATVTVGAYHRVWMPTAGRTVTRIDPSGPDAKGISATLYRNAATQTFLTQRQLAKGDRYSFDFVPYTQPTSEQQKTIAYDDVELPALPALDPKVKAKATSMIGDETSPFGRMRRLTAAIKDQAYLTHGLEGETPSLPGHSEARILSMLEEIGVDTSDPTAAPTGMIGDQEQLAALTAILARSVDIPARVVMGFKAPDPEENGSTVVTGDDATAWVEVAFKGVGWVRFDPTPETTKKPTQPKEKTVPQPKPQVAQPPPPPVEPVKLPPALVGDSGSQKDRAPKDPLPAWAVTTTIAASPFLLLSLLALVVFGIKALRRRRRRLRGEVAARFAGGWQEVLDASTDFGAPPPPRSTRLEIARALARRHPHTDLLPLAAAADAEVFGPSSASDEDVQAYWSSVEEARRSMGRERTWWARFWAAITPRSLLARRPAQGVRRRRGGGRRRTALWTRRPRPGKMGR